VIVYTVCMFVLSVQLLDVSEKINQLVEDKTHYEMLLMCLIKKYHGPHGVLHLLSDKNKDWWINFNCFKDIVKTLKVHSLIVS